MYDYTGDGKYKFTKATEITLWAVGCTFVLALPNLTLSWVD